jgi:hypothetical protein
VTFVLWRLLNQISRGPFLSSIFLWRVAPKVIFAVTVERWIDRPEKAKQHALGGLQDVCGITTQSWQGALRPRCIPSLWRRPGIEPSAAMNRLAVSSPVREPPCSPRPHGPRLAAAPRAGDFALPAPIDRRAFRRPSLPTSRLEDFPLNLHGTVDARAPFDRAHKDASSLSFSG